jgi:hypothetical protein
MGYRMLFAYAHAMCRGVTEGGLLVIVGSRLAVTKHEGGRIIISSELSG